MMKFIIGMLFGGFVGAMWMCLANIVDDIDEFDEFLESQEPEEERCPFCGGHLSEVRIDDNGKEYRYCFGCFHEYEVTDDA